MQPGYKTIHGKISRIKITFDVSHWCNVHESLLADQQETVNMTLERVEHIHARIGHPEGPQVNDPRAPEWENVVKAHFAWWDKVVERKKKNGERMTFLTEFGPPDYMPTTAYTRQPLANQWEINVYMMQLLRKRYKLSNYLIFDQLLLINLLTRTISELIGRFHPVLVHLPIGILLLAGLFQLLALKPKYASLHAAISIALFWGMISAIVSCISGYLLSQSGDYDEELVNTHKWFGISTAFVSLIAYLFNRWENVFAKWVILLMVPLIIITGHLGGSLTHGSDYLTKGFSEKEEVAEKEIKPIADVQEANVYADIIQPIFEGKCYTLS